MTDKPHTKALGKRMNFDGFHTGMGTTAGMWDMLSDILADDGEKLPESLNQAIYALREGEAKVVDREREEDG